MFEPTRDQVRQFFCDAWRKHRESLPLMPIEALAVDWIGRHPEYHALLERPEDALSAEFPAFAGATNPFLHLALHLSFSEQLGIDQPPGVVAAWRTLCAASADEHEAAHKAIEALAHTLAQAQRDGVAPSNEHYLQRLRAAAGRSTG